MKTSLHLKNCLVAFISGALYFYLIAYLWGIIAINSPIHNFAVGLVENGLPYAYRAVISIHDFLVNIILTFPLVLFIYKLKPIQHWSYIICAILGFELVEMYPVLSKLDQFFQHISILEYVLIHCLMVAPILLNFWLLSKSHNRESRIS